MPPWGSAHGPQSSSAHGAGLAEGPRAATWQSRMPHHLQEGLSRVMSFCQDGWAVTILPPPLLPRPALRPRGNPAPLPLPAPRAPRGSEVDFPGPRTMPLQPLLEGFLLPRLVSSVFLRSKRAPCLVANRGRRRGGAAVGGCASSAASRHPLPGRCVSARVHPRHCSCAPRRA